MDKRRQFRKITRLGAAFFLNASNGYLFAVYISPNPWSLTTNVLLCILCLYISYLLEEANDDD